MRSVKELSRLFYPLRSIPNNTARGLRLRASPIEAGLPLDFYIKVLDAAKNKGYTQNPKPNTPNAKMVLVLAACLLTFASTAEAEEEKKTITKMKPGAVIKHNGTLHINCNVPDNALIVVIDGDLIINGDVGESSRITLLVKPMQGIIEQDYSAYKLEINGTISPRADIYAMGSIICNHIMNNCNLRAEASITAGDVMQNTRFNTFNGNITLGYLMEGVCVTTIGGNIRVGDIEANSIIISQTGDIWAEKVSANAYLSTTNGSIHPYFSTVNGYTAFRGDPMLRSFDYG